MSMNRRQALKFAAVAGGSLLLPAGIQRVAFAGDPESPAGRPYTLPFRVPSTLRPVRSDNNAGSIGGLDFEGTDYYQIEVRTAKHQFIPGFQTDIVGYNGTFPGPTIRQKKDRRSVVRFINRWNKPTVTHLHGMAALSEYDGWANDPVPANHYKDYIYPNNRAATIWYHDHLVHKTAENVYAGLAGLYTIYDDFELDLNLPSGRYDVPLMLMDRIFGNRGQSVFDDGGEDSLFGDVITVNGVAWPRMEVERRKYRFRLLNASLSRSYELILDSGDSFIMIGTDAGLRSSPVDVKRFRVGMAERYEFIIDFSKYEIGDQIELRNRSLNNNKDYARTNRVMRFDVVSDPSTPDTSEIPRTLRYVTPVDELVKQAKRTREFRYERKNGLWVINGKTWNPNQIDANPALGDVEIWRMYNNSNGWFHPIHVHLVDGLLISRNGQAPFVYEEGWKDTFYVGGNEDLRVVMKFGPHTGRYMHHCHNTVHEDHDMMRAYQVGNDSRNPASLAPARPLPAPPL
jgi:spore coat protein A, manganese oxidase